MNKKTFAVLITLMGISILGIVIVQLVWMNNAIRVKNELFDRSVNEALTSTTNRLENMQDFRMMNHLSWDDSAHMHEFEGFPPAPPEPKFPGHQPKRIVIPKVPGNPTSQQIERIVRASKSKRGFQYHFSTKGDSSQNAQEDIIVIHADSLERNLDSIYLNRLHAFDSLDFHVDNLKDTNVQLKRRFEIKTRKLNLMADKVVEEITSWEEIELPVEQINELLKKELVEMILRWIG